MSSQIVFDQYQRYRFIQRVISAIDENKSARVLEVGALGSPLQALLPNHRIVTLDADPKAYGVDLRASGLHLPFKNETFGIVVSTDVLEHLDSKNRAPFVKELARVTSNQLILGFPHSDPLNREADRVFYEFIRNYSGLDFNFLKEHMKYGLPETETIRKEMESYLPDVLELKNANVSSWTLLQLGNFILLQHPELKDTQTLLNDFFNTALESSSHGPPNYRTFLIGSRSSLSHEVKRRIETESNVPANDIVEQFAAKSFAFASASEAAIRRKTDELFSAESKLETVREQSKRQQLEIENLQKTLQKSNIVNQNLEDNLQQYAQANQTLQNYLNLFLHHPAYKVYKRLKNSFQWLTRNGKMSPAEDIAYSIFQKNCEPDEAVWREQNHQWQRWPSKPLLNIVTAVFDPDPKIFQDTINSVLNQTYGKWIWNVVDASSDDTSWKTLQHIADRDSRVLINRLPQNQGISANLNVALKEATGDYIVFLDHDDTFAPHALFAVAESIVRDPDVDFLYSDADKLDESGRRCEPLFKPDWSPEMMLCCNLLNQISVFRRELLENVGYLDPEMDGAQDWDLYFRITEKTCKVHHIPQILYHWRKTPQSCAQRFENKPYARTAQISAIHNHLLRSSKKDPHVAFDTINHTRSTHPMSSWQISSNHRISVVIPTSEHTDILNRCLEGLFSVTGYKNLDIILVDTGSRDKKTFEFYKQFAGNPRFELVRNDPPFNFSKACNLGARHSTGSLLLFLNNDVEILHEDWLEKMMQWFEYPEVGAVGPKLLYPNGKIQHAGVIVGLGGLAAHVFMGAPEHTSTIFGTDNWYRNVSAVTGACLMIRKEAFERASGFDENYQLTFSDVDLCLRIRQLGYRIVYTPQARLIHHESSTHGGQLQRADFEYANETLKRWLSAGDPYFNSNLSYASSMPVLRGSPRDSCAATNRFVMSHLPKSEIISLPVRFPQKNQS